MAALGVKEESVENSFGVHHPSPQSEVTHPQGNHVLHHAQYLQPFEERATHHSAQHDGYLRPSAPEGYNTEADRHQVPHPSASMPGDGMECLTAASSPKAGTPLVLQSNEGGGSNSSMKRTHNTNKPSANDPLSHRIIEKRRRDRMNNCLADLSRLIPTYYLKKGRGRIEKTEIIEMAIKYMKHLQAHACNQIETCEITTKQEKAGKEMEHFQLGYQEAMSETLEFLRDSEGLFSGDSLCVRIMNHLTKHCEKIMKNDGCLNLKTHGSLSSSSSSSGYHANGSSNGSSSDGNGSCSNLGSETKDVILTEESAYRSDEHPCSDDRDLSYASSSAGDPHDVMAQGEAISYRPSPGLGSNTSSSGDDNGNRLYKFKSNMKHRFSADSEHSPVKKKRRDSDSYSGFSDGGKDNNRRSFGTSSKQSPYNHPYGANHDGLMSPNNHTEKNPQTWMPKTEGENNTVAVFALSPNGTHYVPLSLDQSLIGPALAPYTDGNVQPILHPVSIYVNFAPPVSTIPFHSQPLIVPHSQESIIPRLDSFGVYGDRNPKEERRRYTGYVHPHTINHPPPAFVKGEIRNIRSTGGPVPDMQSLPLESITPSLQHDQRAPGGGKSGMWEYPGKLMCRSQLPWAYHMTACPKE